MLEVGHLGVDWYQVVVGWQLVVVRVLVGSADKLMSLILIKIKIFIYL